MRKRIYEDVDKVSKKFDQWAENGRAELMEREHGKNVIKFLKKISFEKPFTFLDVGCGNGWVIRKMIQEKNCKKAIGIDKSEKMINQANKRKTSKKEKFVCTDIQSWEYRGKFDFVFSMESLYYVDSIENTLSKIFKILNPGGQFFCGTDFYSDNKSTRKWGEMMKIKMHLHSKKEWKEFFNNAGFETKTIHIKDPKGNKKWKREYGTLFIVGQKAK